MKQYRNTIILVGLFVIGVAGTLLLWHYTTRHATIKIGILYATHGPFAEQEKPLIQALLLAVDDINAHGGINGQQLRTVLPKTALENGADFERDAENMITHEQVSCLIGCRDFITRRSVKSIVEKYNTVLLYPAQWEGLEASPNILYVNTTPNQQIIPIIAWACANFGKKITFISTDTPFCRTIYTIVAHYINAFNGTLLQSHFLAPTVPLAPTIQTILHNQPAVIINIVNESTQTDLFKELYTVGITPQKIPIISLVFSDNDQELFQEHLFGSYISKPYFYSLQSTHNKKFIHLFNKQYPHTKNITNTMQAAYNSIYLWAHAAQEAHSSQYTQLQSLLHQQTFDAPEGPIAVDLLTHCCWHTIHINKIINNTTMIDVWDSKCPIKPLPYPPFNTKKQWDVFIEALYKKQDMQ